MKRILKTEPGFFKSGMARYFQDQEIGDRVVLYTESEGVLVGYITILPSSKQGRSPVENRNFLILMSLKLFKIKV